MGSGNEWMVFEFLAIWMNIHFTHVFLFFFTGSHPMQCFVATTMQRVWEQIGELGTILDLRRGVLTFSSMRRKGGERANEDKCLLRTCACVHV